ncbi:MAG: VWA domain-containing protein [Thermoanaerobaculia bacterium]|nr:VWA domain-containing protein [Thermoanaerobaculia bacterium]
MPRIPLSLLALALALAAALPAQEPPAAPAPADALPQSTYFDAVEVSVVNVEVYVTDKQGRRIKGLTKDDFELFQDDRPMRITNFYAVDEGRVVGPEMPAELAPVEVPAPLAPPVEIEPAIPEDQRLHLVVYVDNFNIRPFNRNRTFRSLREFLTTKLRPGDRVMLVSYDRSLHVRRQFSSDPLVVAAALFELEKMSAYGLHADAERRDALNEVDDARDSMYAVTRVRQYADSVMNDLTFSLRALKEMVDVLAGLPGRKAILYVSDGLPLIAGEDVFYAVEQKFKDRSTALLESRSFDASRRFQELAFQANANRVTFYTLDAAGLRTPTSISAAERDPLASGIVDSVHFANIQQPLRMLAESTGGRAIVNMNDPGPALGGIAEDFQTYYSLGYTPGQEGSGRYHKINVKLKGKARGLEVRHREGYRDKPVHTRLGDGVRSALFFGAAHNPMGITIRTDEQVRRDDGNYVVNVAVQIPIGSLVLIPEGDRHVARARLFVGAMDDQGDTSEVQEVQVPIAIPEAEVEMARKQHYSYTLPLIMRRGPHKLAVGLRDDFAANSSFALHYFSVGRR